MLASCCTTKAPGDRAHSTNASSLAPLASSSLGHTSSCLEFLKTQPNPKVGHQGWANGQHMVNLGQRPALSLSLHIVKCEPPHQIPPGAWSGHLRVRCRTAGGKGDNPEPEWEPGMVGGTTVGWGTGEWEPNVRATRKPLSGTNVSSWGKPSQMFSWL